MKTISLLPVKGLYQIWSFHHDMIIQTRVDTDALPIPPAVNLMLLLDLLLPFTVNLMLLLDLLIPSTVNLMLLLDISLPSTVNLILLFYLLSATVNFILLFKLLLPPTVNLILLSELLLPTTVNLILLFELLLPPTMNLLVLFDPLLSPTVNLILLFDLLLPPTANLIASVHKKKKTTKNIKAWNRIGSEYELSSLFLIVSVMSRFVTEVTASIKIHLDLCLDNQALLSQQAATRNTVMNLGHVLIGLASPVALEKVVYDTATSSPH